MYHLNHHSQCALCICIADSLHIEGMSCCDQVASACRTHELICQTVLLSVQVQAGRQVEGHKAATVTAASHPPGTAAGRPALTTGAETEAEAEAAAWQAANVCACLSSDPLFGWRRALQSAVGPHGRLSLVSTTRQ